MADIALALYGASVKRRETINGRFGDMLSYMLMAVCILKRFEAEGCRPADKVCAEWGIKYCMAKTQTALVGLYENMHPLFKYLFAPLSRINPIAIMPSDKLGQKLAVALLENNDFRNNLTEGVYLPKDENEALGRLEAARESVFKADGIMGRIKAAVKSKNLPKGRPDELIDAALRANIISAEEFNFLSGAKALWLDAIMVDAFEIDDYLSYQMEKSV
jgi:acyl-CoA dehydrogenase